VTRRATAARRRGFTLIELTLSLVLLAIFGTAAVRLFSSQARFADRERKGASARSASRASVNLMLSELRMVEATGGVVSAGPSTMTLRVPQAVGMVCQTTPTSTSVSLLPSETNVALQPTGYGVRDPMGTYTYYESPLTVAPTDPSNCTSVGISVLNRGRAITISPPLPNTVPSATPVILIRRIKYEFKPSQLLSGRRALWRTVLTGASIPPSDELAVPFDTTAMFRYFGPYSDTSVVSLSTDLIRGVDLILNGTSASSIWGRNTPEIAPYRTAVFFGNRQ
jgi:prepilin-type N-terminal cleavage/methylation domain-containing protein